MTAPWNRYNQTTNEIEDHADIADGMDYMDYKEAILDTLVPAEDIDEAYRHGEWNETYFAYQRPNGDLIFIQPEEED